MNVVVSSGEYKADLKRKYVKIIICDENNYFWVINSGGKLRFPGYLVNGENDILNQAVTCLYNFFCEYNEMYYYGLFSFYNMVLSKDKNGKRIHKNYLTENDYFIVKVQSRNNLCIKKYDSMLLPKTYDELVNSVSKSDDLAFREEMDTILKMLPEEIKSRKCIRKILTRR